jgi:hypothetical protein
MSLLHSTDFQMMTRDDAKQRCLIASRPFKIGAAIYQLDYWSQEVMPMHVTNHSCAPNARFNETGTLIALRDIPVGEEITFNYLDTPTPASPWNFACQCGAANCIGWVKAT